MASDNFVLVVSVAVLLASLFGFVSVYNASIPVMFAPSNVSNATVNVTIKTNVAINFSDNIIEWGTGFLPAGLDAVNLSTHDGQNGTNWNNESTGFVLDNIGTVNVTLFLRTDKDNATFIGGTDQGAGGPLYQYMVSNAVPGETDSCVPTPGFNLGQYYDVNITAPGTEVCGDGISGPGLNYITGNNSIRIDILVRIPKDASPETKTSVMTAVAEPVV